MKTLHPKIFGGILGRPALESDAADMAEHAIGAIDLVVVDLYPFEDTVASGASKADIIEKIDIGGISLIRAAAKNHAEVAIIPSRAEYGVLEGILSANGAATTEEERQFLAFRAFAVSSAYDSAICNWFGTFAAPEPGKFSALRVAVDGAKALRYGENPHQQACFHGDFDAQFSQLNGKEISYNNFLDIDAACALIDEFDTTTVAILKHNNACGLASRPTMLEAWEAALAGDPVSAFGGVLIANRTIDLPTAEAINKIFFEVVIAPAYDEAALAVLCQKKNRIVLVQHSQLDVTRQYRSILNGALVQDKDLKVETPADLTQATEKAVTPAQTDDLLFANKIVKHSKSNAIVLAKNRQLLASGIGQTSRVDALKQAIAKAQSFGFDLKGAVMASDAFFPFADCVEIAHHAGVDAVIQPGGSIRDQDTVDYCNANGIAMVITGIRHFKH